MKCVAVAAGLLEIEALLMLARAQALQRDDVRFTGYLLEARAKLGELTAVLFADDKAELTELFVAVAAESSEGTERQP